MDREKHTATTGNTGDRVRSDCQVQLELKTSGGIQIRLQSKVDRMFGLADVRCDFVRVEHFFKGRTHNHV